MAKWLTENQASSNQEIKRQIIEALNLVSTHSWLYHQYLVCMEVFSQFFSSSVTVNIFVRLRVVATSQGNSWSSFKFQAPMYVTIFLINVY